MHRDAASIILCALGLDLNVYSTQNTEQNDSTIHVS